LRNPLPIRLHRVEVRRDALKSLLRTKSVKRNLNMTIVVVVNALLVWLLKKPVEDIDQPIAETIVELLAILDIFLEWHQGMRFVRFELRIIQMVVRLAALELDLGTLVCFLPCFLKPIKQGTGAIKNGVVYLQ
jgi:hypothetical protein